MIVHPCTPILKTYSLSISMLNLIYTPAEVPHIGKKKEHVSNVSSYCES